MTHYLSIDIGGTHIKYALLDQEACVSQHGKVPTPVNENQAILKQIRSLAKDFQQQVDLDGIGISTAGIVDSQEGKIIYAGPTIKHYKDTHFKHELADLSLPIHVENDVNAALLGERWQGAGKEENHLYCMTLGTGIGGAYYQNGLVKGAHLQANSIGYLLYDPKTKTTYEQRASTSALKNIITEKLGESWTPRSVFAGARKGNKKCLDILTGWAQEIAAGMAQIILLIDPEILIIGGGISQQGDFLLTLITEQLQTFLPDAFMRTSIRIAELQNNAALYGAVFPFFESR